MPDLPVLPTMTTKQLIKYMGGIKALSSALNIWPQAIYAWGTYPPWSRWTELGKVTKGAFRVKQ